MGKDKEVLLKGEDWEVHIKSDYSFNNKHECTTILIESKYHTTVELSLNKEQVRTLIRQLQEQI
jgi:hypothetical protein